MDKSKKDEMVREEFRKLVEEEEKIMENLRKEESEDKIRRRKDFLRRLQLERREAALNGVVLKAQEVATLQQNQLEQEAKLASELDLIRREEIVEEKMRLHLRENSHELKELESQLKVAYMKKTIAAQIAEKEANKLEDHLLEVRAREILEKAVGSYEEQEQDLRIKEKKQKEEFRHLLQDQIIEKEKKRHSEYVSFVNEKQMFDEILEKIKEQEAKEMEEKKLMQQKLKEEMEQFYTAREMWKARERFVIQLEDEKIKKINEEKEKLELEKEAKKKLCAKDHGDINERLFMLAKERKKKLEERDELISCIIFNEKEEKEKRKDQEELDKETCRKQEAKDSYFQMLAEKTRRKQEEKDLDIHFAQQMKIKLEEEERKEKETQEKRRQVQISNRKYNEEAMKKNEQKRAESLKLNQLINEIQENEEERKARLIQEERIRMLKEHAPKLLGYFPKGCLKEEDLEVLGITGNSPLPESCPLEE